MLHEFLSANHPVLVARCREKAATRAGPQGAESNPATIDHGVPLFLQQLAEILRAEQLTDRRDGGRESKQTPAPTEIGRAAALHGGELLRLGFTVDQVVHGYGDVCQSVTELAVEQNALISNDEFRTLNRCLDNAIADAVTAFGHSRQVSSDGDTQTLQTRLKRFSDEHARLVNIATQAYSAIKSGNIGLGGATGTLLTHALGELASLPERTLPEIRTKPAKSASG